MKACSEAGREKKKKSTTWLHFSALHSLPASTLLFFLINVILLYTFHTFFFLFVIARICWCCLLPSSLAYWSIASLEFSIPDVLKQTKLSKCLKPPCSASLYLFLQFRNLSSSSSYFTNSFNFKAFFLCGCVSLPLSLFPNVISDALVINKRIEIFTNDFATYFKLIQMPPTDDRSKYWMAAFSLRGSMRKYRIRKVHKKWAKKQDETVNSWF